jgi:hypothetical protein
LFRIMTQQIRFDYLPHFQTAPGIIPSPQDSSLAGAGDCPSPIRDEPFTIILPLRFRRTNGVRCRKSLKPQNTRTTRKLFPLRTERGEGHGTCRCVPKVRALGACVGRTLWSILHLYVDSVRQFVQCLRLRLLSRRNTSTTSSGRWPNHCKSL